MLLGIARFEIRYQLKNPVFWVAIAIFFLLGFGLTASENVSIGTPGAVHENAPYAIAVATAIMSLFYLFVVTAFVANAIVRDDTSGFAPIVRATQVTRLQIILGRFAGGDGYLLLRLHAGFVPHRDGVGSRRQRFDPVLPATIGNCCSSFLEQHRAGGFHGNAGYDRPGRVPRNSC